MRRGILLSLSLSLSGRPQHYRRNTAWNSVSRWTREGVVLPSTLTVCLLKCPRASPGPLEVGFCCCHSHMHCFPISTAMGELKWSSFYGLYYNKQNLTYLLSSTYFYLFVNTAQNRKLAADVALVVISKNGPDARSGARTSRKLILVPRHPPEWQKSIPLGAGIWCFPYITELTYSLLASRLLSYPGPICLFH